MSGLNPKIWTQRKPKLRQLQSARSIVVRDAAHATRHCGDGVAASDRSKSGQIDVEVTVATALAEASEER